MSAPANVILVHGAWADGSCWSSVIERLQADGYHVTARSSRRAHWPPTLPGCGRYWNCKMARRSWLVTPTAARS